MDKSVLIVIAITAVVVATGLYLRSKGRSKTASPARRTAQQASTTVGGVGLRDKLSKTRSVIARQLGEIIGRGTLDDDFWSDLEDTLVAADVGVSVAAAAVDAVKSTSPDTGEAARTALIAHLTGIFANRERGLNLGRKLSVILVVGVNGSGKTTTIAKIASQLGDQGKTVVLGAADTFRAAAAEQLKTWADRLGIEIATGADGVDPASVAFSAVRLGQSSGADVVIVDTAGRLQTKSNLMDELAKVKRVISREAGDIDEVLLVIDGTTGQNALEQARAFNEVAAVTGIVVTKLDGTSRGGVAIAVEQELDIPIKFIGVGEQVDDLVAFSPEDFVDALIGA
ncbi:MAG: signal recognition particle-docking protein FtsY [Acidobacteria bacterium]|nr:signal recognition particle-docking protein FtsY [Acidobacteriota bacterium]